MLAFNEPVMTADAVAMAIVKAARAYGEDPIEVASGKLEVRSRQAAFCALEAMFPAVDKHVLVRCVAAPRGFLTTFERGLPKAERRKRLQVQWQIVAILQGLCDSRSEIIGPEQPTGGRPPISEDKQALLKIAFDGGHAVSEAAANIGVHRNTASSYYAKFRSDQALPETIDGLSEIEPAQPIFLGGIGPFVGAAGAVAELDNESCRWPIGDPTSPDFHFCGCREADFKKDRPYCHEHAAVA